MEVKVINCIEYLDLTLENKRSYFNMQYKNVRKGAKVDKYNLSGYCKKQQLAHDRETCWTKVAIP